MTTFEFEGDRSQDRFTGYVSPYEFAVTVLIDADLEVAERMLAKLAAAVERVQWEMIEDGVRALKVSIDRAPRPKVAD